MLPGAAAWAMVLHTKTETPGRAGSGKMGPSVPKNTSEQASRWRLLGSSWKFRSGAQERYQGWS